MAFVPNGHLDELDLQTFNKRLQNSISRNC